MSVRAFGLIPSIPPFNSLNLAFPLRRIKEYLNEGGTCCHVGLLGGVFEFNCVDSIKDIPNGTYLTVFYSKYPTQNIIDEKIDFINIYSVQIEFCNVYSFDDIIKASEDLEFGRTNGKDVVVADDKLKKTLL